MKIRIVSFHSLADEIHAERKMVDRICWSLIKQWFRRERPAPDLPRLIEKM